MPDSEKDSAVPSPAAIPAHTPSPEPDPNTGPPSQTTAIFFWGLIVGGLLVLTYITTNTFGIIDFVPNSLILATGLGIIVFAFGTRAILRVSGVVIAGAGAVAGAFFGALIYFTAQEFVEIEISGPRVKGATIDIRAASNVVGVSQDQVYHFVAFDRDTHKSSFDITFNGKDADGKITEVHYNCIDMSLIRRGLGKGVTLGWRIGGNLDAISISGQNFHRDDECQSTGKVFASAINIFGIGSALAQATSPDIQAAIDQLVSYATPARRDSRSALASFGLPMIQPLLAAMHSNSSYQMQLGGSVALTLFLRDNKNEAADAAARLNDSDFSLLVDLASNTDRTIRIYASAFLFDLGSGEVVEPAVKKINDLVTQTPRNDDGIYNLVLVLQGAYPQANILRKGRIESGLRPLVGKIGDKTDRLIKSFLP